MEDKIEELLKFLEELVPKTFKNPPKIVLEDEMIQIEDQLGIALEKITEKTVTILGEKARPIPCLLLYRYTYIPPTMEEPPDIDECLLRCTPDVGGMLYYVMEAIADMETDCFMDVKITEQMAEEYDEEEKKHETPVGKKV